MNNINGNMAGKKYVLSSLVMPCTADKFTIYAKKVDLEFAKNFVANEDFISAVGHESTAKLLTTLLGVEIKPNRIFVDMDVNDEAIAVQFLERIAEGRVLNEDELKKMYDDGKIVFRYIKRIS